MPEIDEPFFFLVEHFEAFLFGEAVADFDGSAGFDFVTLFGELGFDAVDVVAHIDLVDHGGLKGVFGDEVLPKKADGLFGGCGGEANEEGSEIFWHLAQEQVRTQRFIQVEAFFVLNHPAGRFEFDVDFLAGFGFEFWIFRCQSNSPDSLVSLITIVAVRSINSKEVRGLVCASEMAERKGFEPLWG